MIRRIDVSYKTIIFTIILILSLWVIYTIRDLLMLILFSVILMSALSPLVSLFTKVKIPKGLGILVTYIIILGVLSGILVSFVPPLIEQSSKLIAALPTILVEQFNITAIDQGVFQSELTGLSKNLFSFTLIIFDNIVTLIFLLVLTFYLLLERENLEQRISNLFIGREERIGKLIVKIEEKLGAWLRGQLFLSLIIGVLAYIGLIILNIPYAPPLALLAGIMEVVPVIGPIIAAIPAIVLAFTVSPVLAAGAAAMYFVIQQLENNLIVPQVMKRAVGLNPLVVILAIAVGSRLLGVIGALLAVPMVVVLEIIVADILEDKKIA